MRTGSPSLIVATPLCAALACALIVLSDAAGEPLATEDPAVVATRKRQASVTSLVVVFQETEVRRWRSEPDLHTPPEFHSNREMQARELTVRSENRVVLDGDNVRFESNNPVWSNRCAVDGEPVAPRFVLVLNGATAKRYHPDGFGASDVPLVTIDSPHTAGYLKSFVLAPIMAAFRGLNRTHAVWPVGDMKLTGAVRSIDGADCRCYLFQDNDFAANYCWLDAGNDYLLRRVEMKACRARLDVEYERRAERLVPVRWVFTEPAWGTEVQHTITVETQTWEFNGPSPSADQFEVPYKEGSEVRDFTQSKMYRVEPDGSLAFVGSMPPDPLVESAPPVCGAWYGNKFLLVGGAVAVGAVLLLSYFLSKKNRAL
jgi:hypothetical protein